MTTHIDLVLQYGPSWLWKTLDNQADDTFTHKFREEQITRLDSWQLFFSALKDGVLLVPSEFDTFSEREFRYGIIPLLSTSKLDIFLSEEPLKYKIWVLRWGIDKDKRVYGSMFYSDPAIIDDLLEPEIVPYTGDMPYTRLGPATLMYESDR